MMKRPPDLSRMSNGDTSAEATDFCCRNGVIARVFPASAKIWLASSVLCCDLTPAVPEVCGEADEEQHREYGQQNMAHIADAAKSGLDALTERLQDASGQIQRLAD